MNFFFRKAPPKISCFVAGIVKSMGEHPEEWLQKSPSLYSHRSTSLLVSIASIDDFYGSWISGYDLKHSGECQEIKKACIQLKHYHDNLRELTKKKLMQPKLDYFSKLGCPND